MTNDEKRRGRVGLPFVIRHSSFVPRHSSIVTLQAVLCVLLASTATGCNIFAPMAYYLSPPQIQKPEFTFPAGSRVAVLIESGRGAHDHPMFNRALHDRIAQIFRDKRSRAEIIPPEELHNLRRANADFAGWSMQRVGRELGATHVLYIRVEELQLRRFAEVPVLEPRVTLRQRVIAVDHPETDARVWPAEAEGRLVQCSRQPVEADEAGAEDDIIRKLAYDTAFFVTMSFFETDLEAPRPIER